MAEVPGVSKKANIYDVANLAGVSHQTVSRVLNNHANIKPATRAKVEWAMAQLNYQPSPAARSLVTSKSNMLGFLVSDDGLYGPAGMLNAMEQQARRAGYVAVAVAVKADRADSWAEGVAHLSKMQVEGLVTIALHSGALEVVEKALPNIPVVAVDTEGSPEVHAVGIDNLEGGLVATRHLLDLGHTKVLHISGPQSSAEAKSRLIGYTQAMHSAGLETSILQGDWSAETGFRIGLELNINLLGYTAIFAANDHLSLGLLKAFRMRGIRVPEDISLIGFDDVPEASYFVPPLTTMKQDFNQLGEVAMGILLHELSGSKTFTRKSVQTELVVRESTARLKKETKNGS